MISGIRCMAASGSMGNTVASLYDAGKATPGLEIFNLEAGATNSPNRLGFFGIGGAPNSPVIVGQFQNRSHVVDHVGTNFGTLVNVRFTGSSTASVSGVPFTAGLQNIPQASGTIILRFTEPNGTAVITQNGVFRAINLTAASGAPNVEDVASRVTVYAAQLADTDGYSGDTTWTQIDDGGAGSPPEVTLEDQEGAAHVHDYHLIVSGSPELAGRYITWGFYFQVEFL